MKRGFKQRPKVDFFDMIGLIIAFDVVCTPMAIFCRAWTEIASTGLKASKLKCCPLGGEASNGSNIKAVIGIGMEQ